MRGPFLFELSKKMNMWCEPLLMCTSYCLISWSTPANGFAKVWHLKASLLGGTVNGPIVKVTVSSPDTDGASPALASRGAPLSDTLFARQEASANARASVENERIVTR